MLTAAVIVLAGLVLSLLVAVIVLALLWRAAVLDVIRLEDLLRAKCAELDALSIAGPPVDTRTGSHDRLPIRDDIRQVVTAYCEGIWHTPNGDTK